MKNLRKSPILLLVFMLVISSVTFVPSIQAGACSDAFAKCLDNMSVSPWWKASLDYVECWADFAACIAKKF